MTAEDAWNELPHYFDGLAMKLVGRRSANESAEAAVEKAWKRLDRHFSQRKLTPKECLQDILDAGEIDKFDEQGHIELAINLEAEIDEAEALGTASAFDEPPLLNEVLYRKIRYFTEEFWGRVAREDAVPKASASSISASKLMANSTWACLSYLSIAPASRMSWRHSFGVNFL